MTKKPKIKSKTVRQRTALKVTNVSMIGAKYAMPFIPATIMTIINWDEWFAQTNGGLPLGFLTLVVATIISIIGIMKKDALVQKNVSPLFVFALALFCVAASFLWLSNVMYQAGMMFLWTACAVVAAAVDDQVQQSVVVPAIKELDEDIKEGGLDRKTNKREQRRQKRLKEMREAQGQAVDQYEKEEGFKIT